MYLSTVTIVFLVFIGVVSLWALLTKAFNKDHNYNPDNDDDPNGNQNVKKGFFDWF